MSVNDKMYIPNKIKIGYQNRKGTYTGKLAYIIYFDEKGKLRKENSWETWRDDKITPDEVSNDPVDGFVINKNVGGVKSSWSWNSRIEKVRVYDPRDFEFEISIPNLLFILQETSAIKGKGLEGEFVYAWSGTELILLPVGSEIYKGCVEHTQRQFLKINSKEMKEGYTYLMKDGTHVMYLGRHPYNHQDWCNDFKPVGKKNIFLIMNSKSVSPSEAKYLAMSGFTEVSECTSPFCLNIYPDELDRFKESIYNGEVKEIGVTKVYFGNHLYEKLLLVKEGDNYYPMIFREFYGSYYGFRKYYNKSFIINKSDKPFKLKLSGGTIKIPTISIPYSRRYNHVGKSVTEDYIKSLDLYMIEIVSIKGKKFKVG
jgi:hypothetical protein